MPCLHGSKFKQCWIYLPSSPCWWMQNIFSPIKYYVTITAKFKQRCIYFPSSPCWWTQNLFSSIKCHVSTVANLSSVAYIFPHHHVDKRRTFSFPSNVMSPWHLSSVAYIFPHHHVDESRTFCSSPTGKKEHPHQPTHQQIEKARRELRSK